MLLRTQCRVRVAKKSLIHTQWRRVPARRFSSGADDPPWFQELRTEMLRRDPTYIVEDITSQPGEKLTNTLQGFLPENWCRAPNYKRPVLPISHYLIWFNPSLPPDRLLPDGTDMLHSPGGPWVRRMWAGGSVEVKPAEYFSRKNGFALQSAIASVERIKDVKLRGKDDDVKIFVTLERQYARLDKLYEHHRRALGDSEKSSGINVQRYFEKRLRDDAAWDDALFKDERTLIFLKERSAAELEAIKAGPKISPKYLDPPGKPDFSHTLTPTRSLLFRYSALTFNAHLIHLDTAYAQGIEGHRSLLVHGPLSLTIMLQAISGYLNTEMKGEQVFESIEYRNLAPLYCDEEMRICGRLKKELRDGNLYDVWIEGTPSGVAVKGIVRTAKRKIGKVLRSTAPNSSRSENKQPSQNPITIGAELDSQRRQTSEDKSSEGVQEKIPVQSILQQVESSTSDQTRRGLSEPEKDTPGKTPAMKTNQSGSSSMIRQRDVNEISEFVRQQSDQHIQEMLHPTEPSKATPTSHIETEAHTSSATPDQPNTPLDHRTERHNPATRIKSHTFILPTPTSPSIHKVSAPPSPVKPTIPLSTRNIMNRNAARRAARLPSPPAMSPVPILRKYDAAPYKPNPDLTAFRHSRYMREGVKLIEQTPIRAVAQNMDKFNDSETAALQEQELKLRKRMEEERISREHKLQQFKLWLEQEESGK